MEFELGQTYSGYKFIDAAKRSKNGMEYRVQNTLTLRMELLKVLPLSAYEDREEAERFMREMRLRATLVHPNIVTLFTAMPLEGRLVMTTELVDGVPLTERLQMGPLPWREAADFARQVLSAVDCAHRQKIVHRDISPDNIIAIPGGVVKLTNFRMAKAAHSLQLTQSGAIIGSLRYISPEQVKSTETLDHRSDLYSVGIVLYEMLAGRTPFNSPSQFELMLAHVNQRPEPPSKFNAAVPSLLDAVALKALEKLPADRYQSAGEFEEALVRAVAEIAPEEMTPTAELALAAEVPAEVVAEVTAEALDLVAPAAVDRPTTVEPEPIFIPALIAPALIAPALIELVTAEAPPVLIVAATELPQILDVELPAVTDEAEVAPELPVAATGMSAPLELEPVVVSVAELPPAIVPETVIVLAAAEAVPPSQPAPVLLPETAIHASLWAAAEVVSGAAQAPAAQTPDPAPPFAESQPVPAETAHALILVPEAAAPDPAPVSQVPDESGSTLSPYAATSLRASFKGRSDAVQWAVFSGTAAFLGMVWAAIWFVTGK